MHFAGSLTYAMVLKGTCWGARGSIIIIINNNNNNNITIIITTTMEMDTRRGDRLRRGRG
jgi:hypothetical protein